MTLAQNFKDIQVAGDFNLVPIINIVPYYPDSGGGQNRPNSLNILPLVSEIKIYEDLLKPFISGRMVIGDATNVFDAIQLSGFERLEFQIMSPNIDNNYDFTIETGHPQHIYSITDRKELSQNSQAYILHFCSQEAIKNKTNFISETIHTEHEHMVAKMLNIHMQSKKPLLFDKTKSKNKFVFPYANPLDHIMHIARKTQSKSFPSAKYLFYENIFGFNFRSLQSLTNNNDGSPKSSIHKIVYKPKAPHLRAGTDESIARELSVIYDYEIKNQTNTLLRLNSGVFSSELVTHDLLNKKFSTKEYSYAKDFHLNNHLDRGSTLPSFPYIGSLNFSELPSVRYFKSNTQDIFETPDGKNKINTPQEEEFLQSNNSKMSNMFNDFLLNIEVPGYLGVHAGSVVDVEIPRYAGPKASGMDSIDIKLTGRYLVQNIEHTISMEGKGTHRMSLGLRKDAFNYQYEGTTLNTFQNSEADRSGLADVTSLSY